MVTICDLPDELVLRALASLPLEDLCRLQRVCRRLQSLAVADGVWEALHQRTYAERDGGSSGAGASSPAAAGAAAAAAVSPSRQAQRGLADTFAAVAVGASASSVASAIAALPSVKRGGEKCRELTLHAAKAQESPAAVTWRERFKARFIEQSRQQRLVRRARRLKAEGTLQVLAQEAHRLQAALAREQREVPLLQAQLAAVQQARQQASTARLAQAYWQPTAVQEAHGRGVVTGQEPQDAESREEDLRQRLAVTQLEVRKLSAALAGKRVREQEARRKLAALQP